MDMSELRFDESHTWVKDEGKEIVVGITAYAQDQLGDIVFVELPEPGTTLQAGETFGTVESVKAVEELVAPLGGTVEARNEAVLANPEELQNDPYGEGWLVKISGSVDGADLLDADAYTAVIEEESA